MNVRGVQLFFAACSLLIGALQLPLRAAPGGNDGGVDLSHVSGEESLTGPTAPQRTEEVTSVLLSDYTWHVVYGGTFRTDGSWFSFVEDLGESRIATEGPYPAGCLAFHRGHPVGGPSDALPGWLPRRPH